MATIKDGSSHTVIKFHKHKIILYSLFVLGTFLATAIFAGPTVASYAQSSGGVQPIFSSPVNLSNDSAEATNPDVWNVGSHVYVAWAEGTNGLRFRESPNGGATWYPTTTEPALNLAPSGRTTAPLLSANGSNVYVVWSQTIGTGVAQVLEATSTNYGQSFSTAVQVSTQSAASITPVIASWGNNVYVAWSSGTDSYVSCSANAGTSGSWTKPLMYGDQHEPEIAAWGGQYVYAVSDAGMQVSSNNCNSWTSPSQTLGETLHPWGSEPWIWSYGPNVYASWEAKGNSSVVYYSYSNNYGVSWTKVAVLSSTLNDTWAPMVWAYGDSAWIAFHTNPGGSLSRIYMYMTNDSGHNWYGPTQLSTSPKSGSDTGFPFTVSSSDGQNVFVAWSQQIKPGYWQLYVSYSGNGGTSWIAPPGIDVSENPAGTEGSNDNDLADAAISAYGTTCFAVWQLMSGSSNQVYFSSSTMGIPTQPATMSLKPTKGFVGTSVTVTGSNFLPSASVTVEFDGTPIASTMSNSGGNFSATFTVPNAVIGPHNITATDGTSVLTSSFTVSPKITEKPVSGPSGKLVNVTGNGFAADSNVVVTFDGTDVATSQTNSQGSFTATYTVPTMASGGYSVEVSDGSGNSASATFTVN